MSKKRNTIKICTRYVKKLNNQEINEYKHELTKLRDEIDAILDDHNELLSEYIRDKWGNCRKLRRNIKLLGSEYFFEITELPVSWDTYYDFYKSDDLCYCLKNCLEENGSL